MFNTTNTQISRQIQTNNTHHQCKQEKQHQLQALGMEQRKLITFIPQMKVYDNNPPINRNDYTLAYVIEFPWHFTLHNVDTREMETSVKPKTTHNLTALNRTTSWSSNSDQVYYVIKTRQDERDPISVELFISRRFTGDRAMALMYIPHQGENVPAVAYGWLNLNDLEGRLVYEHRFERIQDTVPTHYIEKDGFCIGFTTLDRTFSRINIRKLCDGPSQKGYITYQKHRHAIYVENRIRRDQRITYHDRATISYTITWMKNKHLYDKECMAPWIVELEDRERELKHIEQREERRQTQRMPSVENTTSPVEQTVPQPFQYNKWHNTVRADAKRDQRLNPFAKGAEREVTRRNTQRQATEIEEDWDTPTQSTTDTLVQTEQHLIDLENATGTNLRPSFDETMARVNQTLVGLTTKKSLPKPCGALKRINNELESWYQTGAIKKTSVRLCTKPLPIAERYQPALTSLAEQEREIRMKREALMRGIELAEKEAKRREEQEIDVWDEVPARNVYPQTTGTLANTRRSVSSATYTLYQEDYIPPDDQQPSTSGTQKGSHKQMLATKTQPDDQQTLTSGDQQDTNEQMAKVNEPTNALETITIDSDPTIDDTDNSTQVTIDSQQTETTVIESTSAETPITHEVYEPISDGDEELPILYSWPQGIENLIHADTLRQLENGGRKRYRKYEICRASKDDTVATIKLLGIIEMPIELMRRHHANVHFDYTKLDNDDNARRQFGDIIEELWKPEQSKDRTVNVMIDAHKLTARTTDESVEIEVEPSATEKGKHNDSKERKHRKRKHSKSEAKKESNRHRKAKKSKK